jgi:6-phosphogluconolactonase
MRRTQGIFFLALAGVAMLGWAGCDGSSCSTPSSVCGLKTTPGGAGNSAALLYYVGANNILGASLTTTRSFAALTPFTPPTLPSSVGSDMLIVNKKFLYLPQKDSMTIQAFTIDHTSGALIAISGSPFATGAADSIASDTAGRFLFVGNDNTGQISVFQINATTGGLMVVPGSPFSAFNLDFVHLLAVDGSGKFLYAGQGLPALPIYAFSIDQNSGALSQLAGSPFALSVAGVRTDFTGKFAIGLSGSAGDNHLHVFSVDATTGALAEVNNSPFATVTPTPLNLRIHPSSRFVYIFGVDSNNSFAAVEGFRLDPSTGAVTALAGSPFTTLPSVANCKWDQVGSEAFCANANTSAFSVFDTNSSTGALAHTVQDLIVTNNAVPFAPTD